MSVQTSDSTGFLDFNLHAKLMDGLRDAGFETPRPIQAATIPSGMEGSDVLGLAQTGTGKTAAFALPLLQRILDNPAKTNGPRALILAPTRELATQIAAEIKVLAQFTKVKTITAYGGVSIRRQVNELRDRPEIVVGCPGRVLDLLQQRILRLDNVETLVLDEADHMFDMGFLPTIRKILAALPKQRQNLLFSATMPREIRSLADNLLDNPYVAELGDTQPASTIEHALYVVPEGKKRPLLDQVLGRDECDTAIVFTRTKHRARRLAEQLSKAGHNAVALQGNMSQGQRDRAMKGFRERQFNILVATDIVARGIDVSGVSHVINFDVPNTPEAYTHRIGRTGRSETEGVAFTFVTDADRGWLRDTERKLGQPIERLKAEGLGPDSTEKLERPAPSRQNTRNPRSGGQGRNAGPRAGGQGRGGGGGRGNADGPSRGNGNSAGAQSRGNGDSSGGRRRRDANDSQPPRAPRGDSRSDSRGNARGKTGGRATGNADGNVIRERPLSEANGNVVPPPPRDPDGNTVRAQPRDNASALGHFNNARGRGQGGAGAAGGPPRRGSGRPRGGAGGGRSHRSA